MSLEQLRGIRRKEEQKHLYLEKFRKSLIIYSLYLVIFSVFILLNACIGYSSAPFYTPDTSCSAFSPSASCVALKHSTAALYMLEMAFALILCANGCLAVTLCDNLENGCLQTLTKNYSKFGFLLYPALMITRMILYFDVIKRARPEMTDAIGIYAEMFAVYINNDVTQITVTSIVVVLYLACCIDCFCIFKACKRLKIYLNGTGSEATQSFVS